MNSEMFNKGLSKRRKVLGDEYVDKALATADEFGADLQKLITEYRLKFKFPFIIAVKGLNKNQIIDNMQKRVNNSKTKEFETAISEIHKIAELRIKDLTY